MPGKRKPRSSGNEAGLGCATERGQHDDAAPCTPVILGARVTAMVRFRGGGNRASGTRVDDKPAFRRARRARTAQKVAFRRRNALWWDSALANGLSGAHSQAMEYIVFKIADVLIAVCMASVIAVTVWYVAHYVFGVSSPDIRRSALMGAGVFALLVATKLFNKKSK
jgi:hypothetical protein